MRVHDAIAGEAQGLFDGNTSMEDMVSAKEM